ncbi:MAG: acyl-CoA thioesterase [Schaedlerella sp.]|nr:acyl-CoA thioesterase [Schaedlerella sp.]
MNELAKRVSDSLAETVHIVRPTYLNGAGRLFGGMLLQWIDETAGIVAKRHCRMNVTTVSIDNLHFIKGAYPSDDIILIGKLTYVGNSSMEIKVETFVENMNGDRLLINRAYLTFVALDENDKPTRVPRLILETDEEKLEWKKAECRKEIRRMQHLDPNNVFNY